MTKPDIDCQHFHASLYVEHVPTAVDYYNDKLGFFTAFTWGEPEVTMAGVNLGKVQIFLEKGTPQPDAGPLYFVVSNADELYEFHQANRVEVTVPIGDREYGLRDYGVRDLHGHHLSFGQYIYTVGEPIKIQRVDVPVRLEMRLAALLHDLAAYKHMTVSSTLEEILLHTNDQLPNGGCPCPHTDAQLRYIQKLKEKHGIDYDSHGSYRFVEE